MKALQISLLWFVVLCGACERRPRLNHFVIPVGYSGPLVLVSDHSFVADGTQEDTRYVHRVPETGVICVPDDAMLRPSFSLSGEYGDGELIYSKFTDLPSPPGAQAIRIEMFGSWGGDSENSYAHWLAVGTEAEVAALERLFFAGGIELLLPDRVVIDKWDNADFSQFGPYCAMSPRPGPVGRNRSAQ